MQNLKNKKTPKFDLETIKVAGAGISLLTSIMGGIYFYTLGVPIYISGVAVLCAILTHLPFFTKKGD